MIRVACLLIVLATGPAIAEDYLLTVERVETVTTKEDGHARVETSRRTLEVLCRPGVPFLGRVIAGPETTTLAGELWETNEGKIRVEISSSHVVDTGVTVPTETGDREKILDISSASSTVELEPGVPLIFSTILSRSEDTTTNGTTETTKEQTAVITVTEYKPAVEPDFLRG